MIDVWFSKGRFLEISEEIGQRGIMDAVMVHLLTWCEAHCKRFYVGQRGYKNGQLGFEFRFASTSDAVLFKLTWA